MNLGFFVFGETYITYFQFSMKFGKRIKSLKVKEWEYGYIDYKGFKKLMKQLGCFQSKSILSNQFKQPLALENTYHPIGIFKNALVAELGKVNSFFLCELVRIETSFDALQLENLDTVVELAARIDQLRRFSVLNYLAVVKLIKKFEKNLNVKAKEQIMVLLNQQLFCASPQLDVLYTHTAMHIRKLVNEIGINEILKVNVQCCPICLGDLTNPVTIACHHTFCWSCLSKAKQLKLSKCPMCRMELSLDPRDYEIDGLIKQFLDLTDELKSIHGIEKSIHWAKSIHDDIQKHYATIQPLIPVKALPVASIAKSDSATQSVMTIAHRGASGDIRGNTIPAFQQAVTLSADMIELDVQCCASGEVVVYHDTFLPNGKLIRETSLSDIQCQAPYVPTINQVLDQVSPSIAIYFDLKCQKVIPTLMKILKWYANHSMWIASQFYIASFNHYQLVEANGFKNGSLADMHVVALTSSIPLGLSKSFEQIGISHVAIDAAMVNAAFVADAHQRNIQVFVWTINTLSVLKDILSLNVDGIVTDYPTMVINTLQKDSKPTPPHTPKLSPFNPIVYKTGDPVEIVSLHDKHTWHSGVVIATNDNDQYTALWWMHDNSQRRAQNVLYHQLRKPSMKHASSLYQAASTAYQFAVSWTTLPLRLFSKSLLFSIDENEQHSPEKKGCKARKNDPTDNIDQSYHSVDEVFIK